VVFDAAKIVAAPFPVPELPLFMVIQVASLIAVHEQVLGAVTATVAL
jgi:hypothetical protein